MEGVQGKTTVIAATATERTLPALKSLLTSSLYTNAFYLWLNTATTSLSGFAFWALIAALYDPEEVGLGAAAVAAMTLLSLLSHLGLGYGLIRFLPESGQRGPLLLNTGFSVATLAGMACAFIFLAGLPLWSPRLDFLTANPLYFAAFAVFTGANVLIWIQDQAFVALREARYVFWRNLLYVSLRLLFPFFLIAIISGPFSILAAMGLAAAATAVVGLLLLPRAFPLYRPAPALERETIARLLPYSGGNYVSELLLTAPGLILPLMVVHRLSATEAGYFYIAWLLGYLLITASVSLALSLFAEGSHSQEQLRTMTRQALMFSTLAAMAGAAMVLLLADKLLLPFGADYARNGASLLRLVALAAIPAALANLYLGVERVRKNLRALVVISGVMAVVTLTLSYALLPSLGLAGAGVGLLAGQGVAAALALVKVRRWLTSQRPAPSVSVEEDAVEGGRL